MQQLIKSLPSHSHKPYPPHLRIADVQEVEDEQELIGGMSVFRRNQQAEVACGYECPSPRQIVSRLFRRLKDRRRLVLLREENDEKSVDGQPASLSNPALDGKDRSGDGESSSGIGKSDGSRSCEKGNLFNLAIAYSLLYLLGSTKDELSKLKELRTSMELFIQDMKVEIRRKDSGREELMLKESPAASCLTNLKEVSKCNSLLSCCRSTTAPYLLQGKDSVTVSSRSIVCDEPRKESLEGMEQLEAELEAELERLQLHLDTECFPQSMKITGSGSTAKSSSNLSLGEVIDLNEASIQVYGRIPPVELERKLHELLESRQQERIKELEVAVECIMQKLSEKEREATRWKDTALLLSHHVLEPTGSS